MPPFGDHYAPPFAGMGRSSFGCPFRGDSPNNHNRKPAFGPFGWARFDRSPEKHCHREPEQQRWGPFEHYHRGFGRRGPSESHCCGHHSRGRREERSCCSPGTDRPHPWFGRNAEQHCCGRRGQSGCSECHCRRTCEGRHTSDYRRSDCCRHASCCDQRRSCRDHCCKARSIHHCENCCESEPCCGENKEDLENDNSLERNDNEVANERDNKIRMMVLWLLRELLWKTVKGHHISDAHMGTVIISTTVLQRALKQETDRIVVEDTYADVHANKTRPEDELD